MTRSVVLRGVGLAVAVALGAVAVWLIVTGSSQMDLRLGALAGFWGLFVGACAVFGTRRSQHGESVAAVAAELELRAQNDVEPVAQAEARRAFEQRLEQLLRTEIGNAVNREVGDLRREVAALRQELLEKVGGQLRLERIETTRLIGSDLEALQHEVRQLKTARDAVVAGPRPVEQLQRPPRVAESILSEAPRPDPVDAARAIEAQAAAERQRAEQARAARDAAAREKASREQAAREQAVREQTAREQAAKEQAAREQAARTKAAAERAAKDKAAAERAAKDKLVAEQAARAKAAAERAAKEKAAAAQAARAKAVAAERAAKEKAAAEQARAKAAAEQAARAKAAAEEEARAKASQRPAEGADPFASMPRITPFTDFELDPVDDGEAPEPANGTRRDSNAAAYTGRRRAGSEDVDGRPSRHAATPEPDDDAVDGSGRRRRQSADDDLLSTLLSRKSAER